MFFLKMAKGKFFVEFSFFNKIKSKTQCDPAGVYRNGMKFILVGYRLWTDYIPNVYSHSDEYLEAKKYFHRYMVEGSQVSLGKPISAQWSLPAVWARANYYLHFHSYWEVYSVAQVNVLILTLPVLETSTFAPLERSSGGTSQGSVFKVENPGRFSMVSRVRGSAGWDSWKQEELGPLWGTQQCSSSSSYYNSWGRTEVPTMHPPV